MSNVALNQTSITKVSIGQENTPVLIIDNFAKDYQTLIEEAGDGSLFSSDVKNYYPGKRKQTKASYAEQLCSQYFPLFKSFFGFENAQYATAVLSAFAISDQAPEQLRPMQMVPHFDTTQSNQLAVVHYLCEPEHGGTAFYRHRASAFETITAARLLGYGTQLKKEAMENQLHLNPCYIQGSNNMFEQIYSVNASMNRAVIYPSNLLHSGNINPLVGLSSDPKKGRLTIGSFIVFE
ncbi:hypothetical protein NBRC116592_13230 [Colwellia sp. KU-HH00111]|mgnify:CR=1 FL=1|uniref:DUF6445 family protein n=1 Tax=Colwellia sp. KU-HH00111 TaxID=3127652 RepID=UPI003105B5DC